MSNDTPGILFAYFEIAVLLTVPVSLILILWYRRAVTREMRVSLVEEAAGPSWAPASPGAVEAFAPTP